MNIWKAREKAEEYGIPDRMILPMLHWVLHGRRPAGFLSAVIQNDLRSACQLADGENVRLLPAYVMWFVNWVPSDAWGSRAAFRTWKGASDV